MKLMMTLDTGHARCPLSLKDRIVVLGSCFADEMGRKLRDAGFDVLLNPFGTLYNPESIASSIERMESGKPYTEDDCVPLGAGDGRICSFEHHTSFARREATDFLKNANEALDRAHKFWHKANKVIITYGTARVWRHDGRTVSNCLKRPGGEFTHELLSLERITEVSIDVVRRYSDRNFLFTVSPRRYPGKAPHDNTVSKSLLHLGILPALEMPNADYFPAYEILMDELRDYRYYAADLLHPRDLAVDYIWERFKEFGTLPEERESIEAAEKAARAARHRVMSKDA